MIIVLDVEQADTDLRAGALTCQCCSAVLRPWSTASPRRIRQLDGSYRLVRPRRGTLLGLPGHPGADAGVVPARRADAAEVIGAALVAKARGQGNRTIARDLDRPVSTVRRWCAQPEVIRWSGCGQGFERIVELDQELLAELAAQATALGDALCALAAAVLA